MEGQILVIEDDVEIIEYLTLYLEKEGFTVAAIHDSNGLGILDTYHPDLIILDVVLPGKDGFTVCEDLRKQTDVPVLFFSCRDSDTDTIRGLGIGGDDYISKLTSPGEIVARVKALLRRDRLRKPEPALGRTLRFGDLEIQIETSTVFVKGSVVNLSSKEFQLLLLLAMNPDRVYNQEQLFQLVWNIPSLGDPRTVKVHINNLRKKIEHDPTTPRYIHTVRGLGYKFNGNAATSHSIK